MYSKDAGKDQMLMTMERALTSGQKAGFFFLGFLGGIVGILAASLMNINAPYRPEGTKMAALAKLEAKIKRREAALDAFAVAEAYCKESWMVSRCEREGFDGFIIDLCSDAEDETIRLVRLVPDSEDGIMDDVFRLEYGSCEYKV